MVFGCEPSGIGDRRRAGKPLVGGAEVGRSQSLGKIDFIAVVREVTNHKAVLWKPAVEERFEPACMLHRVGHTTAKDADVVAFLKLQSLAMDCLICGQCDAGGKRHPCKHVW